MALIKHYLKRGDALTWLDKAQQLIALQQQLNMVMQQLSPQVHIPIVVMYYDAGDIHLGVPHQAWLVRIKNLSPKIIASLTQAGYEVSRIKVKMQLTRPAFVNPHQTRSLPAHAKALLSEFQQRLPDECLPVDMIKVSTPSKTAQKSLRDALAQLIERS